MAHLELAWRDADVSRFLDFVVDGESLHDRVEAGMGSCLGWFGAEHDELSAARLLRKAPPDAGDRVAIYVCPHCGRGDHECGAVTVRIVREGDEIVWCDLSFTDQDGDVFEHRPLPGVADLRFPARDYRAAITNRP